MASDNYNNNSGGTLDFAGVINRQIDRILFMSCNIQTTGSLQEQVTQQAQMRNAQDMRFAILMLEQALRSKLSNNYKKNKEQAFVEQDGDAKFDVLARWFGAILEELPRTGLLDKQAKIMYDEEE